MVRKGWQPLWTHGGGGSGSSRPASAPSLVTSTRTNPFIMYEEFLAASVGEAPATYGHSTWAINEVGTAGAGSAGCGYFNASVGKTGWLQLASGATSGDGIICDLASRGANNGQGPFLINSTALDWVGMWRFTHVNGATARSYGMGWIQGSGTVAPGTNWVTDPLTTLAAEGAIIIHCDTAAYGTATAGAICLRVFDTASGVKLEHELVTTPVTSQAYKIEIAVSDWLAFDSSYALKAYVDGVLSYDGRITFAAPTPTTGDMLRPSAGIVVAAATARGLIIDTYYHEIAQATLR